MNVALITWISMAWPRQFPSVCCLARSAERCLPLPFGFCCSCFPKEIRGPTLPLVFNLAGDGLLPVLSFYLESKSAATARLACGVYGFDCRGLVPVFCLGGDCFGRFGAGRPGDLPGAQAARSCSSGGHGICWLRIYAVVD